MLVFSGENVEVEIYLDDGSGSPNGGVVYELIFRRALAASSEFDITEISHLGYEYPEYEFGNEHVTLTLSKVVESDSGDVYLSNALYYIRVKQRTDDFSSYVYYNFKKCRRASWSLNAPDTGVVVADVSFICESWDYTVVS